MDNPIRVTRLLSHFNAVVAGKRSVESRRDALLLLEAIYTQTDRAQCITRLMASKQGMGAMTASLRIDLSSDFLNGPACMLIHYVTDEEIARLNGGQILHHFLTTILDPPMLWNAFKVAFEARQLTDDGTMAYAKLVYRAVTILSQESATILNIDIRADAELSFSSGGLLSSSSAAIRNIAYKIREAVRVYHTLDNRSKLDAFKPGGRHDNDHHDFRQIAIFPTADELGAKEPPYYVQAEAALEGEIELRAASHLDNQFRLLREDMLAELREDLAIARGLKQNKRVPFKLKGLQLTGVNIGQSRRRINTAIALRCYQFPRQLPKTEEARKSFFVENKSFLKHQSFGCLYTKDELIAFAVIHRDEDLLAKIPSVVLLQIIGDLALTRTLSMLKAKRPHEVEFVIVDTPFFAFEPILRRLQAIRTIPFKEQLLGKDQAMEPAASVLGLRDLADQVKCAMGKDVGTLLELKRIVTLDKSQTDSLVAGLTQAVSLIQGPPGTGKSFVGALLTRALLQHTDEKILILCYTNHALDQFIDDILNMGVSRKDIVRLGSKSSPQTEDLSLYSLNSSVRESREKWQLRCRYSDDLDDLSDDLQKLGQSFSRFKMDGRSVLQSLEFSEVDADFFFAFSVPGIEDEDGMVMVDAKGRPIQSTYLIDRWINGKDAGIFKAVAEASHPNTWSMPRVDREALWNRWTESDMSERVSVLQSAMRKYSHSYDRWDCCRDGRSEEVIKSKRIVACTTTGAAKASRLIECARAGIVIVEEAGEVLESHIITALSSDTKQLVMIGDHLQLRPKVSNFALTIERGDGYDLNRSLFERLVIGGYGHTTLAKQHRMRPEISSLVRRLMYPGLEDAAKTQNRPDIRGLQSNVVFIDHSHMETVDDDLVDRRDGGSKQSKQNKFEARMVLSIVRYLAQQGYGTDEQVVLTPYLGQLKVLMDLLKHEHDPVLNDLDSHDLVKAGLLAPASAKVAKKRLRLSTIDNFQGEESGIVVISLTRANQSGDIGFLSAAQRLNVLLSRARNGLIIIGNSSTFRKSRKGGPVWGPFLDQLSQAGNIFDGLPVRCERHPTREKVLKQPEDFNCQCPDGGCTEPCPALLKCKVHRCPQRCHALTDHSQMRCLEVTESKCSQGHKLVWRCWQGFKECHICEAEAKKRKEKEERDLRLAERRREQEEGYAKQLRELDDEIAQQRQIQKDNVEKMTREQVLKQRKADLVQAKALAKKQAQANINNAASQGSQESSAAPSRAEAHDTPCSEKQASPENDEKSNVWESSTPSEAKIEWEYEKQNEGANNEHIDNLMSMIGLEAVKQSVLDIKTKVDTCLRQGASLQQERFGAVLLGNPGTGKTTVARIYAKFLASVGVLPGTEVQETTAARLISGGVPALKKMLEDILNAGGGALFIDEAYQLVTTSGGYGSQILDYLLAEVENLTGKLVVILAGYDKQMEDFFAHNPGLPSRFPHEFRFSDYTDQELLGILRKQVDDKYGGGMKAECGLNGLYCRIAARRVGYGRGRPGFGNARAMANVVAEIAKRQGIRLKQERRQGAKPDDLLLTKEDIIMRPPSEVLTASQPWKKLNELIGLETVKESVGALLQSVSFNYERELREEPRLAFNLNRVFFGSPGTGKTTVATLYGKILADLGLLSKGEVVVKNPSDFVGDVLGASEKNTKGILASTIGKVLVIDEAYGLYAGEHGQGDIYKTAVIDTLVAEVQSVPGEDRCVLLLGYKNEMEVMFQKVNPGLSRRFPLSEAFVFEDFTDEQLRQVLVLKLKQQAFKATDQALDVAMACLARARNKPNFGNAGEIDILLNGAKARHQMRCAKSQGNFNTTFEAIDVDPEFDRTERSSTNIRRLFEGVVGLEDLVVKLEGYQRTAKNLKARGIDPRTQLPFNFLFSGPPGTGKTTTARKMGHVYYDMGFLATKEVVEISATDLIGQYIGQTGPKTQAVLKNSLGKVLFIDEAYRLAEGQFAREAMDELVDGLTKPDFAQRLVVILAGYDHDINRLMAVNPGLTSRFPETVTFDHLQPRDGLALLVRKLQNTGYLDLSNIDPPSLDFNKEFSMRFDTLKQIDNWANGRDVETIAKNVANKQLREADASSRDAIRLGSGDLLAEMDNMIRERYRRREGTVSNLLPIEASAQTPQTQTKDPPITPFKNLSIKSKQAEPIVCYQDDHDLLEASKEQRDVGVSDETWAQLGQDKAASAVRKKDLESLIQAEAKLEKKTQTEADKTDTEAGARLDPDEESPEDDEERRRLEKERLQREIERRRHETELEKLRKEIEKRKLEHQKEAEAQRKLRAMGVCVAGFRWIKQVNGYRCAGGSHFITHEMIAAS